MNKDQQGLEASEAPTVVMDQQDLEVERVRRVHEVEKVHEAYRAQQVLEDYPGYKASLALLEHEAYLVRQVQKEMWDLADQWDSLDLWAPLEKDARVPLELEGLRVRGDRLDHQGQQDLWVREDLQGPRVRPDR